MLDSSASLEHSFSNDDINVAMYLTTVFFGSFSIVLMNNNGLNLSRVREQQSSPGCSQQWAGGRGDPSTVTLIGAAAALSSVTERKLFFCGNEEAWKDGQKWRRGACCEEITGGSSRLRYSSDSLRSKREKKREGAREPSPTGSLRCFLSLFSCQKKQQKNKH